MLSITISGIRCRLSLLFPAVLLYLIYLDPSGIVLFGFSAAFIHEGGHLLAAYIFNNTPKELVISCFGMRLIPNPSLKHTAVNEIRITLAGPIANILMCILFRCLPISSLYGSVHLVMALFNLLPICPLDGGRALSVLLEHCCGITLGKRLERFFFYITSIPLLCLGILLAFQSSHNFTLLIVAIYLIFIRLFYNGN